MTPGIGFFYAGMVNSRNALSMIFTSLLSIAVVTFQVNKSFVEILIIIVVSVWIFTRLCGIRQSFHWRLYIRISSKFISFLSPSHCSFHPNHHLLSLSTPIRFNHSCNFIWQCCRANKACSIPGVYISLDHLCLRFHCILVMVCTRLGEKFVVFGCNHQWKRTVSPRCIRFCRWWANSHCLWFRWPCFLLVLGWSEIRRPNTPQRNTGFSGNNDDLVWVVRV